MICKKNKDAWYYFFNFLTISSAGSPLATVKNVYCRKNTAIFRWPPLRVTAFQVMRTWFLVPIPRLSPPAPPPRSPPGTHECILYELFRYLEKEGVLKFLSNASLLNFRGTWGLTFPIKCMTEHVTVAMVDITYTKSRLFYGAFSITWLASMQIYWNKRKRLHKKRVQLPKDCFGTPIWPPWRHVKTLYWSSGSIPQGTCFCKLYNFEVTGGG